MWIFKKKKIKSSKNDDILNQLLWDYLIIKIARIIIKMVRLIIILLIKFINKKLTY